MSYKIKYIAVLILGMGMIMTKAGTADDIRTLTGKPTRIVWVQDQGNGTDVFAKGSNLKLMGFDTEDGQGERAILSATANYKRPLFTSDGTRVVYSDVVAGKVYIVNWDGSGKRFLVNGQAGDVQNIGGTEWVYVINSANTQVTRYNVDNTSQNQVVWNKVEVNPDWLQVSADGKRMAAAFPWPHCGMAVMNNVSYATFKDGCWPSITPDNNYKMGIFDDLHRNWFVYNQSGTNTSVLNLNSAPGIKGWEIYHPKWSNNVSFVTITGPYSDNSTSACLSGDCGNKITKGGLNVEVYIGKLNSGWTGMAGWVKVTANGKGDFYPEVFVGYTTTTPKVGSPVITPPAGTYYGTVDVSISCATPGAVIRYTTDGSTPTSGSTLYSGPFSLADSRTVRARAFKSGMDDSDVTSTTYTIQPLSTLHLKINAGPGSVAGWQDDDAYLDGGNDYTFAESAVDVSNVTDPGPAAMYQTVRHLGPAFTFPQVPDGDYTVRLHYKDGDDSILGRQMVITIEGRTVETAFNIREEAGAAWTAVIMEYNVNVADGNGLTIGYDPGTGNDAFVSGIEIIAGYTTSIPNAGWPVPDARRSRYDRTGTAYDLQGRRVDLQNVPAGVYLVPVAEGKTHYRKITITR